MTFTIILVIFGFGFAAPSVVALAAIPEGLLAAFDTRRAYFNIYLGFSFLLWALYRIWG